MTQKELDRGTSFAGCGPLCAASCFLFVCKTSSWCQLTRWQGIHNWSLHRAIKKGRIQPDLSKKDTTIHTMQWDEMAPASSFLTCISCKQGQACSIPETTGSAGEVEASANQLQAGNDVTTPHSLNHAPQLQWPQAAPAKGSSYSCNAIPRSCKVRCACVADGGMPDFFK